MTDRAIRVAVVTGGHCFEVPALHGLFGAMRGVEAFIQSMDDFCCDEGGARATYDAVVFYNMHTGAPRDDGPWYWGKQQTALGTLGQSQQGIFLLHHAILAFPDWPQWREMSGLDPTTFSAYAHGQQIDVHVADRTHPITRGLADWRTTDETYTMAGAEGPGSQVLLTTDHPQCIKTLAWTRQFRQARVFCFQLGHDGVAMADAGFRQVVRRGVRWVAGKL